MKYSVSVVKRITLLIMTMALAVALVACQAATSVKGEQGAQGAQGEAGPAGPPGTLDNEPPMVVKELPMVYLALAGSGKKNPSDAIDLSDYFSDAENAALNYDFSSDPEGIAEAKLDGGKMVVEAKKAGSTTITVTVYDGVTAPVSETFDVMVVASNARPVVKLMYGAIVSAGATDAAARTAASRGARDADGALGDNTDGANPSGLSITAGEPPVTGEQEKLRMKLYGKNGARKTEISATIHAGRDTFEDEVLFSAFMGKDGKADDIVDVMVSPKAGKLNTWVVTLTPIEGKAGMQNVYVVVTDKFGAMAEMPEDLVDEDGNVGVLAAGTADAFDTSADQGKVYNQAFQFVAFVNTKPSQDMDLPDKTFLGIVPATGDTEPITGVTSTNSAGKFHDYLIGQYFSTDEKKPAEGPKIGGMEKMALAPGMSDPPGAGTTTTGRLSGGAIGTRTADDDDASTGDLYNDVMCEATANKGNKVVEVAPLYTVDDGTITAFTTTTPPKTRADRIRMVARGAGTDTVTITCGDDEHSVTDTVTVTVRAAR